MAKSDQPSTSTQGKPIPSPDKVVETGKKASVEMTEDQLKKVAGGYTLGGSVTTNK
jgi:hypothetical protein